MILSDVPLRLYFDIERYVAGRQRREDTRGEYRGGFFFQDVP
jgi:hypothetical protein